MTEYQYTSPKSKLVSSWIDASDEKRRSILEASGWTITATRGIEPAPAVVEAGPPGEAPAIVAAKPTRKPPRRKRG